MKINNLLNINSFFPIRNNSEKENKQIEKILTADDNLEISNEAQTVHKFALQTNDVLNDIEKIQQKDISKIKENLKSGYYSTEKVLTDIASSILDKDEYQSLFMNDKTMDVIEEYIDLRETDINKINSSKNKVDNGFYNQEKIYNKVADDVINIYS